MGLLNCGEAQTDINTVDMSPDRTLLLAGDDSGNVRLYAAPCIVRHAPCRMLHAHSGHTFAVRFISANLVASIGSRDRAFALLHVVPHGETVAVGDHGWVGGLDAVATIEGDPIAVQGDGRDKLALLCHWCGKEMLPGAFASHLKTCRRRVLAEKPEKSPDSARGVQQQEEEEEQQRRPQAPSGLGRVLKLIAAGTLRRRDADEYNEKALRAFRQVWFRACPHCNRHFPAQALDKHLRLCRADRPIRPLPRHEEVRRAPDLML